MKLNKKYPKIPQELLVKKTFSEVSIRVIEKTSLQTFLRQSLTLSINRVTPAK